MGWVCCFQVLQAGTNYRNGHTGQLSTLSVLLTWAGSLGVGFVTLQVCSQELHTTINTAAQLHIPHYSNLLLFLLLTEIVSNIVCRRQGARWPLCHTYSRHLSAVSSWPRSSATRAAPPLKRRVSRGGRWGQLNSYIIRSTV